MPIPDRSIPDGVKCICGRQLNQIHCPNCGSFHVEGRVKLGGWRCMRCKAPFNDEDRGACVARALGDTTRATRAAEVIQTELAQAISDAKTPEERRARLGELFKKVRKDKETL